ncbi:sialate O-acetylesterase [Neptunicella marina]|uniref:Beta galactosidase jelly roll domain-containing protein n=1 Tax=Neptunicella marina TaxID=2125989 RepID=A0A8J6LZA6_9ALTE|nr:sialate O-acetylesterase [Neptunicella marina]MBC3765980.1 beta galactosidase jelly roll domain-containing protein [Neptunicella marina]
MRRFSIPLLAAAALSQSALADVTLPKLISDGMILQRDQPVKIWGWADANESVTVRLDGKLIGRVTSPTGEWSLTLPAQDSGKAHTISIKGNNSLEVKDVLFGEVWLASGQSNMELPMERVKERFPDVIAAANYPTIRQFNVSLDYDFIEQHQDYPKGQWVAATPQSVLKFSAVAFFFARDLQQKYQVPVGIIKTPIGGTPVQAWMSEGALKAFPTYMDELKPYQQPGHVAEVKAADKAKNDKWYGELTKNDLGLQQNWQQPDVDDSDWQTYQLPGLWPDGLLEPKEGVVWFRKTIDIPANMAGKQQKLMMGRIIDADQVFVNGQQVGNITYQYPPRRYTVPAGLLKAGKNSIVVRVVNSQNRGGFVTDKPYWLGSPERHIDLTGSWKCKVGATAERLPSDTFVHYKPTGLFNAMIYPALNYTIKGVIWYQGESNTGHPSDYHALFSSMIQDWRKHWHLGDFPFLFVQLANFQQFHQQPVESGWAELRQQQLDTLSEPNTGMAVITDVGEWNDIHPLDKQTVGHRLSLAAQHIAYGEDVVYSGPIAQSAAAMGNSLVVSFNHTGSGLKIKGDKLTGFAIAGRDGVYHWAKATISGNKVELSSDAVSHPVKVRYGWQDNPENANLYNEEGLPASPFELAAK